MKFTFGDSKNFANVHIFETIKKELDARVMEGVFGKKQPFKEKSRFLM